MFLTTHASAGILIASHVHNPYAAFGLAFVSHFVLDFIPHGDENLYRDHEWRDQKKYRRVVYYNAIDLGALAGLTLWAYHLTPLTATGPMLLAIFGAILPDFLSLLFPVLHERLSWLFLVRWLYSLTKPTGLRYIVRAQNWIHEKLHHEIFRKDLPFRYGLALQVVLTITLLTLSH